MNRSTMVLLIFGVMGLGAAVGFLLPIDDFRKKTHHEQMSELSAQACIAHGGIPVVPLRGTEHLASCQFPPNCVEKETIREIP